MRNRCVRCLAVLVFMVDAGFLSAGTQPRIETRPCRDAMIIAIEGQWRAHPDGIRLAKWSCVDDGRDLVLDESASSGLITVVYHRGGKPPVTVECPTREACRNAYRVEIPVGPPGEQSIIALIKAVFSAFFEGGEPVPVPGIVKAGSPQTAVMCRTADGRIDLAPALPREPGDYTVVVRPRGASAHRLRWESGPALIDDPADRPMLYELELRDADNLDQGKAIVLAAHRPACEALTQAFQHAVQWTETWPANTPGDAIRSFLTVYLQALAQNPPRALQE
jgi:hypothetical protein